MRNERERHLNTGGRGGGQVWPRDGAWLAALILAGCVVAWPWLSGRVTVPWDAKAQFLPQLQFLAQSLGRGESPFWTPYVFGGHPQIADAQSLIFSPPFLLLALLNESPSAWAMDVTLYLCVLASAAALFFWLRGKGIAPLPAFAGALSFAFGASMAWRIQHTGQVLSLAYLPFVLLLLDHALAKRSIAYGAAAGLAGGVLVLGRDQVALLGIYFLIAYVAVYWLRGEEPKTRFKASLAPLTSGTIAGLALVALPILMTALLAQDSNRPAIDLDGAGRGSLHPALFLTALAPDVFGSSGVQAAYWGPPSYYWQGTGLYIAQNMGQLYIGAVPALALLWGLFAGAFKSGDALFLLCALALTILYALGWYTPVFSWMHAALPGVDLYRRPADATFLIGFLASALSAFALDRFLSDDGSAKRRAPLIATAAAVALGFTIMIALALEDGRLVQAAAYILLPAALFVMAAGLLYALSRAEGRMRDTLAACIALLTVADLAYSNGPGGATALSPDHYEVLEPDTANATISELAKRTRATMSGTRRDRVELAGLGFHWPNAALTHGLESTLGYNPVRLAWVTEALGAGDTVGLPEQRGFSALFPSYRSPLADLLGLRFIATGVPIEQIDKTLKADTLPLVARTPEGYIYENAQALPRVMFAPNAEKADFAAILQTGTWPRTDFQDTVLIEHEPLAGTRAPGTVKIVRYANTQIELEVDSPQGGYVVLNDIWHPWWFATVDGTDTALLRANVIFRSVSVPPGVHRIVFEFRPVQGALKQFAHRD